MIQTSRKYLWPQFHYLGDTLTTPKTVEEVKPEGSEFFQAACKQPTMQVAVSSSIRGIIIVVTESTSVSFERESVTGTQRGPMDYVLSKFKSIPISG